MNSTYNQIPGIQLFDDGVNPTIASPYSPFSISFYLTRKDSEDPELYQSFLKDAIREFRRSRVYKHYKGQLIDIGLNRDQMHSDLTSDMVNLEMHHNILTIYDIAVIISEHILNTVGHITTFDLIYFLRMAHTQHQVQVVMLSLTEHQLLHNTEDVFIHPNMCFGKWWEFLELYHTGITKGIARKLITRIERSMGTDVSTDGELSRLREKIKDWSGMNGYGYNENITMPTAY